MPRHMSRNCVCVQTTGSQCEAPATLIEAQAEITQSQLEPAREQKNNPLCRSKDQKIRLY